MTSYTFRGQVKVSDVQAAFDDFTNRINTMVSTYNTTNTALANIDLSVGSPTLAAAGYTLTIGGIKQLLEAYDGVLIGCRAFRVDSTHIAVTDGVYLTKDKPYKINAQILTGNGYDIYLAPETGKIGLVNDNSIPPDAIIIAQLSNVSGDIYLSEFRDVQLEAVQGYKIIINKKSMSWGVDGDSSASARFQGAGVHHVNSAGADNITFSQQETLSQGYSFNGGSAKRAHASACPSSFLFIPKGQSSPIIVNGNNHTSRTNYGYTLKRGDA